MATYVLTDVEHDLWVESFSIDTEVMGCARCDRSIVTKRRLHGGRRDGVDLIEVRSGDLSFSIIPTRGMGIWRGVCRGNRLGWDSPVADGPVNPAFVNLASLGGIGWLDGFDELLARCGLAWSGAPFEVKTRKPDGSESNTTYGLHGKIANTPASYVAVHIEDDPPHGIVIEGHVDEAHYAGPGIRMITRISTDPKKNRLIVRDEFVNLRDQPTEMQILYHWNFGPPFLEDGGRFAAPIQTVTPRDPRSVEGLKEHDRYGPPEPGSIEQAYYYELHTEPENGGPTGGQTSALLHNAAGDKGVVLRYQKRQLPCFTLWKSMAGHRDGYVTGLEPATNYPNPRPYEKSRNRVVTLPVDGRYVAETALDVLTSREAVDAVVAEIAQIQKQAPPVVDLVPKEPFVPEF
jgi:hypothetical protein